MSDPSTYREYARDAAADKLEASGLPIDDWSIQPDALLIHPDPEDGENGVWVTVQIWVDEDAIDAEADAGCDLRESCDRAPGDPCPLDPGDHAMSPVTTEELATYAAHLFIDQALAEHRKQEAEHTADPLARAQVYREQNTQSFLTGLRENFGLETAGLTLDYVNHGEYLNTVPVLIISDIRLRYSGNGARPCVDAPCGNASCGKPWVKGRSVESRAELGSLVASYREEPLECPACWRLANPRIEPNAAERLADLIREIAACEARYYAAEDRE